MDFFIIAPFTDVAARMGGNCSVREGGFSMLGRLTLCEERSMRPAERLMPTLLGCRDLLSPGKEARVYMDLVWRLGQRQDVGRLLV